MTRGLFDAFKAGQRSMTALVVAILAMGLASCESRISSHGHAVDAVELNQIVPGETRLADLQAVLGRPSFEGAFESGKVYYISEVMVEPPGGRKRASTRTLIVISLDGEDIVTAIEAGRDEWQDHCLSRREITDSGRYLRSNGTAVLHPSSKAEINLT